VGSNGMNRRNRRRVEGRVEGVPGDDSRFVSFDFAKLAHEIHACKVHAHGVHAYEMHANEVHAHNVHAREVHAHEIHAH
jgi:hypothetical protein